MYEATIIRNVDPKQTRWEFLYVSLWKTDTFNFFVIIIFFYPEVIVFIKLSLEKDLIFYSYEV